MDSLFFFQAEDGIRDVAVTGVQTCALPISLAAQGPRAALHGESSWRRFELPFDISGASQAPSRLEINLMLPGRGAVWLGPMHLQRATAQAEAAQGGWWSARSGTLDRKSTRLNSSHGYISYAVF